MRAFILGNSGELLDHDLNLLKGEVVFGSNAIALHKPEIITNYVGADIAVAFLPEMRKFLSPTCKRHYSRLVWNTIDHDDNVEVFDTIDFVPGFNMSSTNVYLCKTVSYAALQIAASMGYNPIYLLGVDCGFPANGIFHIPEHAHMVKMLKDKNLRNPTVDKRIVEISSHEDLAKKVNADFVLARSVLDKEGIRVYNLSTGGNLRAFPRKVYEDIISNHETEIVSDVELSDN